MKRLGLWVAVLSLLLWAAVWTGDAFAQVDDAFEPQVELISPEGSSGSGPKGNGESALMGADVDGGSIEAGQTGAGIFGGDGADADEAKSGGFWGWLADHGLGLVKGIGAGLIGAAVVGLGAVVIGVSAPVLLTVAGAAVLGGAIYGLVVGSGKFNWAEAIVGSVIGGVSAGVGSWISAAGSAIAAKVGVAVTNIVAGGLTSLSSYLINSPERTWGGALGAFALGSAASGVFMGLGAAASRFWTWGKRVLGLGGGARGGSKSMVQVALAEADPPVTTAARPVTSEMASGLTQTRGDYLRAKYGHLSRVERTARIDQLAGENYQRHLQRLLADTPYVYRYTSRATAEAYQRVGRIIDRNGGPTYMTTEFSESVDEVMRRAQILPSWTKPEVGIKVPTAAMRVTQVARPKGNTLPEGWELYTFFYPEAGPGHWVQFLGSTDTFDPAWVFQLGPGR